jgi:predicted ATPase
MPARVEAVIAERIGRLAQPLRAVLRVASVEGEVFTAEVVARVQGADGREVVGHLSGELDRRHRLVRAQAIERLGAQRLSRYRFRNYLFQKYLYDSLDDVERAYLHEDVGNALEGLYGDQASAALAPQLARHFEQAGIAEKAIHYLHQAGERAVELSAYQEGITHLSRGLELLSALPASPERAQQELVLQLSLGMAWTGSTGYGPEVNKAYTRARELSEQLGETGQLCRVLGKMAVYQYVRAEHQKTRGLAEEALGLAQQAGDPLLVAVGHWQLGFVSFALGEYRTAHAHLEKTMAFYGPQKHHHPIVLLVGSDVGPSALAYDACCLWCLGYPDQAAKRSEDALALARELGHPYTMADILTYAGCLLGEMRRDAHLFITCAEELKWLASDNELQGWLGMGTWYRGEAQVMQGHVEEGIAEMREGLEFHQFGPARCYQTGRLYSLAEAQAKAGRPEEGLSTLAETLALVEQTDERYAEAEIYRVQAELLLMQGDEAEAEASLQQAIDIARRQSAKSWELRATTSLARLWQAQGKIDQARQMLAEVYGWFSEGFDTPDLLEAKALLEELS